MLRLCLQSSITGFDHLSLIAWAVGKKNGSPAIPSTVPRALAACRCRCALVPVLRYFSPHSALIF